ncbi:hypothetical protein ACHAXS_013928 [Conticribra weissflogii]
MHGCDGHDDGQVNVSVSLEYQTLNFPGRVDFALVRRERCGREMKLPSPAPPNLRMVPTYLLY